MKKRRDPFPAPYGFGSGTPCGVDSAFEIIDMSPPPGSPPARTRVVRDKKPDGEPYWRCIPINRDLPAPPAEEADGTPA